MENLHLLSDFSGILPTWPHIPAGRNELLVDELESGLLFAELESIGSLLCLIEDGLLFLLRFFRRFRLGPGFL